MAGKIQYGISNVYYAIATEGANGVTTYGTPVHMPGGENLSISNDGNNDNTIWADNIKYWNKTVSSGMSGDLQMAKFPNSFYTDILGMTAEEGGGYSMSPNDVPKEFALMFQLETDTGGKRVVWYGCTATVPTYTAATATDSITEGSETSSITAAPKTIKTGTNTTAMKTQYVCETGDDNYATFFDAVPLVVA